MKKTKTVKCRYSSCLHESKELNIEDAIKVGKSTYYHKDCFKQKEEISEIISLFAEKVNPNVVIPALRKVINDIVHNKGISSDYLLFGLKYYVDHNITLNYPGGLYYVIQNKEMDSEYKKMQTKHLYNQQKKEFTIEKEFGTTFTHKPVRQSTFADILGGK